MTKLFSSLSFAALFTNVPINHSSIFNFQQTVYKHCEKRVRVCVANEMISIQK